MKLINLSNSHISFEFATCDLSRVDEAIRKIYGPSLKKTYFALCTKYEFHNEDFTFQNEWDDPCLIAGSEKGDKILESLFNHITK